MGSRFSASALVALADTFRNMDPDQIDSLAASLAVPPHFIIDIAVDALGSLPDRPLSEMEVQMVQNLALATIGKPPSYPEQQEWEALSQEQAYQEFEISNWRQFDLVQLNLESRLTILTGENGTGKTSLLRLLSTALEGPAEFLGTPVRDEAGFFYQHGRSRPKADGVFEQIGLATFKSGRRARLGVQQWSGSESPAFTPQLVPGKSVPGLYIDAQRILGPYQRVEYLTPRFISPREIIRQYHDQIRDPWAMHVQHRSPALVIKEALIAAAMFGEGNSSIVPDPVAAKVWNDFQEVLRQLFPASLGFERLRVDQGEVAMVSRSGAFAFEAASGGVGALVSLAWQIYLHSLEADGEYTVFFDEPETHLHPSLQRAILPALLKAFPRARFVVATHSPFVVTSQRDASVYALRRRDSGSVYSQELDLRAQAKNAEEVLAEVLGVATTVPIWAEEEWKRILAGHMSQPRNSRDLNKLLVDLEAAGLESLTVGMAEAVTNDRDPDVS